MKKIVTLLTLTFFGLAVTIAQNNQLERFSTANKLYENGEFLKAENEYKALLVEGYNSGDLHFNLANSLFKSKQIAFAILHYEKALKINPTNKDAAYNLNLANKKTVDKIEAIPELFIYRWWKSIYNLNSADQWAWIMITCLGLGLILFALYIFSRNITVKKLGFYSSVSFLCLGLSCWVLAANQKSYLNTQNHAIITQATVDILSAPSAGSSQLFVLHEGTKVKIKDETEGWLKISLPNGNEGWISKETLALI